MKTIMLLILVLLSNVAHAEHLEQEIALGKDTVVVVVSYNSNKISQDKVKDLLSWACKVLEEYPEPYQKKSDIVSVLDTYNIDYIEVQSLVRKT